jgi:hypothetical protein
LTLEGPICKEEIGQSIAVEVRDDQTGQAAAGDKIRLGAEGATGERVDDCDGAAGVVVVHALSGVRAEYEIGKSVSVEVGGCEVQITMIESCCSRRSGEGAVAIAVVDEY